MLLGCSQATVRYHAAQGTIPSYRVGRTIRFMPEQIEAWRQHGGTSSEPAPSAERMRRPGTSMRHWLSGLESVEAIERACDEPAC